MIGSLRLLNRAAIAAFVVAILPVSVLAQTSFSFNIVLNDGVDFQVEVIASTSTSPSTLGSATIDIEYDGAALDFTEVDPSAGAIAVHNENWFNACVAEPDPPTLLTCAGAIPHAVGGEALNDGVDYVRVTMLPTTNPNQIGDDLGDGFLVDGMELTSTPTAIFRLDFTFLPPEQRRTTAKTFAPADLSFRTNSLSFGYFENQDNTPQTGVIVDDCNQSVGNGCDTQDSSALPVELTNFAAVVDNGDVTLTWSTASETNNAGFSVEHAAGEKGSFDEIAFVDGAGTSIEARNYTYTVKGLDVGTHRFRLKQLDYDGAFEYSQAVEATIELAGTHRLGAAYPNPFNPSTTFELVVGREQHVQIDVINALGQRVQRLFEGSMEANKPTNFTFQAGTLPTGLYFYRVVGENFAQTRQALLVK